MIFIISNNSECFNNRNITNFHSDSPITGLINQNIDFRLSSKQDLIDTLK